MIGELYMSMQEKDIHRPDAKSVALRVSKVSIIVNVVLSVLKLIAGIVAHSGAMVSDAIHSASDVFSTIIVIVGVMISNKEADKEHPYGHERMECAAAIILATVLVITGIGIGETGVKKIIGGNYGKLVVPGVFALVCAIISIVVKEWMYWYTIVSANKIKSDALKADAWHHRSDALSSVGALIGIGGARLGFPVLEPIASVVICIFIFKAAIDIFKDALDKMVDTACEEEEENRFREIIMQQQGVMGISSLQTRKFGPKIYVDVEIEADGNLKLFESHTIAENVHDAIEEAEPLVKHCMVHVNPYEEK